jgi:hypothetical protein
MFCAYKVSDAASYRSGFSAAGSSNDDDGAIRRGNRQAL